MRRLLVPLLLLVACDPAKVEDAAPPLKGPVEPDSSVSLLALVQAQAGSVAITWTADLGAITAAGVYTAPSCAAIVASYPGDIGLVGALTVNDTVHAAWSGGKMDIPIAVVEPTLNPALTVSCEPGTVEPGGMAQCTAWWRFACHTAKAN